MRLSRVLPVLWSGSSVDEGVVVSLYCRCLINPPGINDRTGVAVGEISGIIRAS